MKFVDNKIQCALPMRIGLGHIYPNNAATLCHLRSLQVAGTCNYALRAPHWRSVRLRYLFDKGGMVSRWRRDGHTLCMDAPREQTSLDDGVGGSTEGADL